MQGQPGRRVQWRPVLHLIHTPPPRMSTESADSPAQAQMSPLIPTLATRIVEMIRRDNLAPGHRLTEQALCDELGVSRSPVRKALQYLASNGVVASVPHRGFQRGDLVAVRQHPSLR